MNNLIYLLPYVFCLVSLLVGYIAGSLLSVFAQKGGVRQRVRERLTVYSSLLIWLVLSILLWITDQNNLITRRLKLS